MSTGNADVFPGARLRQIQEWGYPYQVQRPTPPADKAWSVIHITGNSRLPSADGEVTWRITDPDMQNSATFFVNRDGSVVQALGDPLHMDPYANGDVNQPDRSNPRIDAFMRGSGYYNANELTLVAIENVGYEPGSPLTDAQVKTCAAIIRYFHRKAGLPINRETVIGHYQINSVDRPNCPGRDKSVIDEIVALAGGSTPEEEDTLTTVQITPFAVPRGFTIKTGIAIPSLRPDTLEAGATQTFTDPVAGTADSLILISSDRDQALSGRYVSIVSGPFKGRWIPRDSVVLEPATDPTSVLQTQVADLQSDLGSTQSALSAAQAKITAAKAALS